jgi:hypothetical protein
MEVHIDGMMPKEYAEEFLILFRDFDRSHPGCHFDITTNEDTCTLEEARGVLDKVYPELPKRVYKKGNA